MSDKTQSAPGKTATAPNPSLAALRLGWRTCESYSRLYQLVQSDRRATERPETAERRFDFSDRQLRMTDELDQAVEHLHALAAVLELPAPPFPQHEALAELINSASALDDFRNEVNHWGLEVWTSLMSQDEMVARCFTYGGSLADTYWHTVVQIEDLESMLSSYRLEYIAARFNSIEEYLPEYVAEILAYHLKTWQISPQVQNMDQAERRQTLRRLASQAKVWYDLLFGGRYPESYVTPTQRKRFRTLAILSTALAIGLGTTIVWLVVLFLYQTGNIMLFDTLVRPLGGSELDFSNFQNSAILATVSALVVFLGSIFNRLSGWIGWVYHTSYRLYMTRALQRATLRPWQPAN